MPVGISFYTSYSNTTEATVTTFGIHDDIGGNSLVWGCDFWSRGSMVKVTELENGWVWVSLSDAGQVLDACASSLQLVAVGRCPCVYVRFTYAVPCGRRHQSTVLY